jgi:hypothetical protein
MSLTEERPMLVAPFPTEKRVSGARISESSTTNSETPADRGA